MIHDVITRTFNLSEGYMLTNRPGAPPKRQLEQHQVFPKSLYWSLPIGGNSVNHIYSHILPSENIAVTQFGWKEHINNKERHDYYVDIINVTEHNDSKWHMRDLYLDLLVYENSRFKIEDTDEYLAAIEVGNLQKDEANQALETLNDLVNQLGIFEHSLVAYLASKDIHLEWNKV